MTARNEFSQNEPISPRRISPRSNLTGPPLLKLPPLPKRCDDKTVVGKYGAPLSSKFSRVPTTQITPQTKNTSTKSQNNPATPPSTLNPQTNLSPRTYRSKKPPENNRVQRGLYAPLLNRRVTSPKVSINQTRIEKSPLLKRISPKQTQSNNIIKQSATKSPQTSKPQPKKESLPPNVLGTVYWSSGKLIIGDPEAIFDFFHNSDSVQEALKKLAESPASATNIIVNLPQKGGGHIYLNK